MCISFLNHRSKKQKNPADCPQSFFEHGGISVIFYPNIYMGPFMLIKSI